MTSTEVLAHFNPDVLLGLACDASGVGIGGVIYPKYEDRSERPIAYASKTLSDAERNYFQIEREALSIIFGVKKLHQLEKRLSVTNLSSENNLCRRFN